MNLWIHYICKAGKAGIFCITGIQNMDWVPGHIMAKFGCAMQGSICSMWRRALGRPPGRHPSSQAGSAGGGSCGSCRTSCACSPRCLSVFLLGRVIQYPHSYVSASVFTDPAFSKFYPSCRTSGLASHWSSYPPSCADKILGSIRL